VPAPGARGGAIGHESGDLFVSWKPTTSELNDTTMVSER
jgi:hypothetical protein